MSCVEYVDMSALLSPKVSLSKLAYNQGEKPCQILVHSGMNRYFYGGCMEVQSAKYEGQRDYFCILLRISFEDGEQCRKL